MKEQKIRRKTRYLDEKIKTRRVFSLRLFIIDESIKVYFYVISRYRDKNR